MRNHWTDPIALLALIFLLLRPVGLTAAEIDLRVELPTGEVRLGETLELALTMERPESYSGTLEVESPKFPGFDLVDVIPGPEIIADGRIRRRDLYRLVPLAPGTFEIAIPGVRYIPPSGDPVVLAPQQRQLIVKDVPDWEIDAIDIRDIRPPVGFPIPPASRSIIWKALLLALLASLILAIVKSHRKVPEPAEVLPPPVDAWKVFVESLERLRGSGLLQRGEDKEFVLRLSMIFREYLGHAFAVAAPDFTTEEVLEWVATEPLLACEEIRLQQLLDDWDGVKFAGAIASRTILEELAADTHGLVQRIEGRRKA